MHQLVTGESDNLVSSFTGTPSIAHLASWCHSFYHYSVLIVVIIVVMIIIILMTIILVSSFTGTPPIAAHNAGAIPNLSYHVSQGGILRDEKLKLEHSQSCHCTVW